MNTTPLAHELTSIAAVLASYATTLEIYAGSLHEDSHDAELVEVGEDLHRYADALIALGRS